MSEALERYQAHLRQWSDIQGHLPRLFDLAQGAVLELGVRSGVSTSAFLAGVESHGGQVWSIDHNPDCAAVFKEHPLWHFVYADSEDKQVAYTAGIPCPLDLLFIDTEHTYEKTRRELLAWMPLVRSGGRILLHDTDDGLTFPGVRRAIHEICGFTRMYWLYPESAGLGEILC